MSEKKPARWRFLKDDDCHWYLIPDHMYEYWELFEPPVYDDSDEDRQNLALDVFCNTFDRYRIGGGTSSWTFENPQEDIKT